VPCDAKLAKDMSRQAANHTHNDTMRAWKQKEKARSAARRVVKEWREDTPTQSSSSSKEEEGEVTLPPQSSPHITPPPFSDIASP
jgi:hypothetical protein